ncbi:MAG TPA: ankyrin repeat domain-containing protein [Actinobacteria bacterium]|nr:ankyrin repeat domain-containing protein [Actinomycetota bacterium]
MSTRGIGLMVLAAVVAVGCSVESGATGTVSTTVMDATSTTVGAPTTTVSSPLGTRSSSSSTNPTPSLSRRYCGWAADDFYLPDSVEEIVANHPVLGAVVTGDIDELERLLEGGADPDDVDETYADSALTIAIASDCDEAIDLLLEHGASPNVHAAVGFTPVEWAIERRNHEVLQRLLDAGADLNTVNHPGEDYLPIIQATQQQDLDAMRILVDAGADVNIATWGGTTTAIRAAIAGNWMEGVKFLSEAGANLTSVAFYTFEDKDLVLLRYLLEHGASPVGPGNFGPSGPCPDAPHLTACFEEFWPEGALILREYGG